MKPRHKRLAIAGGVVAAVGVAAALVLNAFQSNLVFFFSPSQIAANEAPRMRTFRIGGMVVEGSVKRDGTTVRFVVTDTAKSIPVRYTGILPDLFKEGKGVVAQGQLAGRRVRRPRGARQARRELHAARGRRGPEERPEGQPQARRDDLGRADAKVTAMIPELGHFLLWLALGVSAVLGTLPLARRAAATAPTGWRSPGPRPAILFALVAAAVRLPRARLRRQRLLGAQRRHQLEPLAADGLPLRRDLGQPRGLDAAVDADARRLDRRRRPLQPPPARQGGGAHPRRDGLAVVRLPAVHAGRPRTRSTGWCRRPPTAAT